MFTETSSEFHGEYLDFPARNVVPKPVSLSQLTDVLQRLVEEGVSIRPLRDLERSTVRFRD